jgi:seryl-tRNA synthetase
MIDPDLKHWMLDEKQVVRALRKGAMAELQRCARVAENRNWGIEKTLAYIMAALADYFAAEIAARNVSE